MDYYTTNEFGDLISTTDSTIGIPTKGYYGFEIYDTDDAWTNRRNVEGGFYNSIIPGIRIPSTLSGDVWLGGWEGTWTGLFEYDLLNRKRKEIYQVDIDTIKEVVENCDEINYILGKSLKIKENDCLIKDCEKCIICFEQYKVNELKRIIPVCNHIFHKKCIDKWLKSKSNCPICRCNFLNKK
jgi:hypothetical protein